MDDSDFIQRLKDKDQSAFRTLVETNQDRIVNTCFGFVQNRQDAEDLAQRVFMEAFRSIGKFRGDSQMATWLYRIAVNQSLNRIKSTKRRGTTRSLEGLIQDRREKELPAAPETAGAGLEREERMALLQSVMKALPKNQRIALTLNKYEDLSYREVAKIMEISESAVTALINRGKVNLRKRILAHFEKSGNKPQSI